MSDLIRHPDGGREHILALALDGLCSAATRRAYAAAMDEFLTWAQGETSPAFTKALAQRYKSMPIEKGLASATINQRLAAVRGLALEAADNGLIDPAVAAAVCRVRGVPMRGVRLGRWLGQDAAERLLDTPRHESLRGKRDRAILGLLFGGGLRRSEVAALDVEQFRIAEERWVIGDLLGKGGRIRTVPIAGWTKALVDEWIAAAGISAGRLFRRINRCGRVTDQPLGAQTVYNIVRQHGYSVDPSVRPHDLRRSFARLAYENDAAIDQLSITLGHASLVTTERYVGARQNFRRAPCDVLTLNVRP